MNSQLVEWEVGVGFFAGNTLHHIGSTVWYFVTYSIEEAGILLEKEVKKYCEGYTHGSETIDYSHEWLAMRAVDQITWKPHGEAIKL